MTSPMNIASYERTTGRPWAQWVALLDDAGARGLEHPAIVPIVMAQLAPLAIENAGWWAQGITIGYEQHIGRRLPGQQPDGTFAANVSRTVPGTMDEALEAWSAVAGARTRFTDHALAQAPTTSATPKWRYWRCALDDDSKVVVTINDTGKGSARVAVGHQGLATPDDVSASKAFWKGLLAEV